MNSIEGSHKIPTYVEYIKALIFGRFQFPPFVRTYSKSTSESFIIPARKKIGVKLLTESSNGICQIFERYSGETP